MSTTRIDLAAGGHMTITAPALHPGTHIEHARIESHGLATPDELRAVARVLVDRADMLERRAIADAQRAQQIGQH